MHSGFSDNTHTHWNFLVSKSHPSIMLADTTLALQSSLIAKWTQFDTYPNCFGCWNFHVTPVCVFTVDFWGAYLCLLKSLDLRFGPIQSMSFSIPTTLVLPVGPTGLSPKDHLKIPPLHNFIINYLLKLFVTMLQILFVMSLLSCRLSSKACKSLWYVVTKRLFWALLLVS